VAGYAQQKVININSQTVIREKNMEKEAVLYTAGLRTRYENPRKI